MVATKKKSTQPKLSPITEYQKHPFKLDDATVIHVFDIGGNDAGVISITRWKGTTALDLRRFYLDDADQVWKPSSKGIRLASDVVSGVLDALHDYHNEILLMLEPS